MLWLQFGAKTFSEYVYYKQTKDFKFSLKGDFNIWNDYFLSWQTTFIILTIWISDWKVTLKFRIRCQIISEIFWNIRSLKTCDIC